MSDEDYRHQNMIDNRVRESMFERKAINSVGFVDCDVGYHWSHLMIISVRSKDRTFAVNSSKCLAFLESSAWFRSVCALT